LPGVANDVEFAHFSLTGARFDAPGMPAETASEISAYRELIYSIARHLWVDAHPGRQRVPVGFKEAFDLRLTEVRSGSARPQLLLHRPSNVDDTDFAEWQAIYFQARDTATEAVRTINAEGVLPRKFPRNSVVRLRALGRTLNVNEQITVGPPRFSGPKASLDEGFRRIISAIDDVFDPEPEEVIVEGGIFEFDSSARSFRLMSVDGDWITCSFDPASAHLARGIRAFLSLDGLNAPDVRVVGQAVLDEEGLFEVVSTVQSVERVRSMTEKAAIMKLQQMADLHDGWVGPDSRAVPERLLRLADQLLPIFRDVDFDIAVGPTAEGSIVLEWVRVGVEYTAEIDADLNMFLCADDTATDELDETTTEFNRATLERFLKTGTWSD
jgi:hypothetical protein